MQPINMRRCRQFYPPLRQTNDSASYSVPAKAKPSLICGPLRDHGIARLVTDQSVLKALLG